MLNIYKKYIRPFLAGIYTRSPFFSSSYYYRSLLSLLEAELKGKQEFQVLEIGSFKGRSAALWGRACKRAKTGYVTCVDWWQDKDIERAFYKTIQQANVSSVIVPIKGNSNDVLPTLRKQAYDFIFVDGGHSYSQAKNDILNAIPLLKDGGILCGDDLDYFAHEVDKDAMLIQKENEVGFDPKNNMSYHPGVTLAMSELFPVVKKDRVFWAFRREGDKLTPIQL